MNWLKDIPFFRREFAKVWRNGYNTGFDDGDKLSWHAQNEDMGYKVGPTPSETPNPYGDI